MVTPCAHVACLDCTAMHRTRCPLPACAKPYTMQAVDDPERKAYNPNPKWEVRGRSLSLVCMLVALCVVGWLTPPADCLYGGLPNAPRLPRFANCYRCPSS
jgi:hypothetical protein